MMSQPLGDPESNLQEVEFQIYKFRKYPSKILSSALFAQTMEETDQTDKICYFSIPNP